METESEPELMTMAEFRRRYSISNSQTYREVKAGRLRITKLGTASRIAREHAHEWKRGLDVLEGGDA